MKRVLIPEGVPAKFIHSLPESATPAIAANFLANEGHSVAVLVEESIPKAEEWGEDVAAFLESLDTERKIEPIWISYFIITLYARIHGLIQCHKGGIIMRCQIKTVVC